MLDKMAASTEILQPHFPIKSAKMYINPNTLSINAFMIDRNPLKMSNGNRIMLQRTQNTWQMLDFSLMVIVSDAITVIV